MLVPTRRNSVLHISLCWFQILTEVLAFGHLSLSAQKTCYVQAYIKGSSDAMTLSFDTVCVAIDLAHSCVQPA